MNLVFSGHGEIATEYQKLNPDVKLISFRKLNDTDMQSVIKESDVIVHNAANTWSDERTVISENFGLTKKIVYNILKTKQDVRFINIGSMSYLHPEGFIGIERMSAYTYSKFLSEMYVLMTLPNKKLVRFSTIFYKNHARDGLSKLTFEAVNNKKFTLINSGNAKRDWIPINVATKYLDYVIKEKTDPVINICSGYETSFFQIGKILTKLTGVNPGYENKIVKEVMSTFKRTLPEIKFSLEDEVKDYISKL